MIEIYVCRGGAVYDPPRCDPDDESLNWGDPISDAVLCTEDSALEAGRVAIDESYVDRQPTTLTGHSSTFTQPGSLVSVSDTNETIVGRLDGLSLSYAKGRDNIELLSELNLECLA